MKAFAFPFIMCALIGLPCQRLPPYDKREPKTEGRLFPSGFSLFGTALWDRARPMEQIPHKLPAHGMPDLPAHQCRLRKGLRYRPAGKEGFIHQREQLPQGAA